MSTRLSPFVVDINFNNKEFTPKEIQNYVELSNGLNLVDPDEITKLKNKSSSEIQEIINLHNVDINSTMTNKDEIGKRLAKISLDHSNALCSLISKGWRRKGMMI